VKRTSEKCCFARLYTRGNFDRQSGACYKFETKDDEGVRLLEDEFEYCEICKDPLLDEDIIYEGVCNHCGDGN
jgi:hypothetical protein